MSQLDNLQNKYERDLKKKRENEAKRRLVGPANLRKIYEDIGVSKWAGQARSTFSPDGMQLDIIRGSGTDHMRWLAREDVIREDIAGLEFGPTRFDAAMRHVWATMFGWIYGAPPENFS